MTAPARTYHYLGAEPKRRADGWESLGDIGRLDAEGYLYLGDRLADMILRGGANIYPAEVEAAVTEHPEVRSCVVVGLPDPEFGQRVHAILELDASTDAQAVADGMAAFLADRLSRYKHPESFETVSVGLRDDSGKVRRTLLRDERAGWLKDNRDFRIMPARAREGGMILNPRNIVNALYGRYAHCKRGMIRQRPRNICESALLLSRVAAHFGGHFQDGRLQHRLS